MKKLAMLFTVLTVGCLSVHASDRSETKVESNDSASNEITKIRTLTVYQDDCQGGYRTFQMDLVQSGGEKGLPTPTQLGYPVMWAIKRNPLFRKANDWKGRFNYTGAVSGLTVYFNL